MIAALDVDVTDGFDVLVGRIVQLASDPAPLALDEEWPDIGTVVEPIPWEEDDQYLLGLGYLPVRWGYSREVWTHRHDLVVWAEEQGCALPPASDDAVPERRRINVAVNADQLAALDLIMEREQISLTEAVRRLMGYGEYVYRAIRVDGDSLRLQTADTWFTRTVVLLDDAPAGGDRG